MKKRERSCGRYFKRNSTPRLHPPWKRRPTSFAASSPTTVGTRPKSGLPSLLRATLAGLASVEGLLADPPAEKGILYDLVMWDANTSLDHNPTDEGAAIWLEEVAEMVREVLGDKLPPRLKTS